MKYSMFFIALILTVSLVNAQSFSSDFSSETSFILSSAAADLLDETDDFDDEELFKSLIGRGETGAGDSLADTNMEEAVADDSDVNPDAVIEDMSDIEEDDSNVLNEVAAEIDADLLEVGEDENEGTAEELAGLEDEFNGDEADKAAVMANASQNLTQKQKIFRAHAKRVNWCKGLYLRKWVPAKAKKVILTTIRSKIKISLKHKKITRKQAVALLKRLKSFVVPSGQAEIGKHNVKWFNNQISWYMKHPKVIPLSATKMIKARVRVLITKSLKAKMITKKQAVALRKRVNRIPNKMIMNAIMAQEGKDGRNEELTDFITDYAKDLAEDRDIAGLNAIIEMLKKLLGENSEIFKKIMELIQGFISQITG